MFAFKRVLTSVTALQTYRNTSRWLSTKKDCLILGIETSCDETGCALVNQDGTILSEVTHSQLETHLKYGGIIPTIAADMHREHIKAVADETFRKADVTAEQIDAVAVTVLPGMPRSLEVGLKYGQYLCMKHRKPLIPINHMKAHALVPRLYDKTIEFPFLVLLISGGNCQLAIAKCIDEFALLGSTIDDAPGEILDKIARRLKLNLLPEYANLSGGSAMELAGSKAVGNEPSDTSQFKFPVPLLQERNCQFSFAGIKSMAQKIIDAEEEKHHVEPDCVMPDYENFCASVLTTIALHCCYRLQRAMEYVSPDRENLIPKDKQTLVVSGGVACNNYIGNYLQNVCNQMDYRLIRPPINLCTDNGVMIAWNGVEKWLANSDIIEDFATVQVSGNNKFEEDLSKHVEELHFKCDWVKFKPVINGNKPEGSNDSKDTMHYHSLM